MACNRDIITLPLPLNMAPALKFLRFSFIIWFQLEPVQKRASSYCVRISAVNKPSVFKNALFHNDISDEHVCLVSKRSCGCHLRQSSLFFGLFVHEDGGDMFLRNIGWLSTDHTAAGLSDFSVRGAARRHFSRQVAQHFRRKFWL
jgi:hypothetical protein